LTEAASRAVEWSPADYAANSASQHAWARELIAGLDLEGNESILDVGCGDGKVSAELARAVPRGNVLGIDSSAGMIAYAQAAFAADQFPNLEFRVMDARRIRTAHLFDLVFSNAALHWVDDHRAFLAGAAAALRPGGHLVLSCGGKGNAHDVFGALRAEMRQARWKTHFRNLQKPYFFYTPEDYRDWLPRFGFHCRRVELAGREMAFSDTARFAGWLRTTWLPYTQRVPEPDREAFIDAVARRYLARHPQDEQGRVRVKMVRLEIDADRGP
jgi:trans-aconitate methyltransferase